ncbi:MAG: hypothetical protein ACRDQU_07320 [Pseudonocardiaceae bacterium]
MALSDEEVDLLQVEAAASKRRWYREPSVLVAALALAVSVGTLIVGQLNVISDRGVQDRNRLSALIAQLPAAQDQGTPGSTNLVFLISSSAAALIDKLGPEASTAAEKIEVALALVAAPDLPGAKRLATAAEQQSTNRLVKFHADEVIAEVDFQAGDVAGGREVLQRLISLLQTPQNELDSPVLRDVATVNAKLLWASDEFSFAKNCQGATEQLKNAKQTLDRLPSDRVVEQTTALNNLVNTVNAGCAVR